MKAQAAPVVPLPTNKRNPKKKINTCKECSMIREFEGKTEQEANCKSNG